MTQVDLQKVKTLNVPAPSSNYSLRNPNALEIFPFGLDRHPSRNREQTMLPNASRGQLKGSLRLTSSVSTLRCPEQKTQVNPFALVSEFAKFIDSCVQARGSSRLTKTPFHHQEKLMTYQTTSSKMYQLLYFLIYSQAATL